MPRFRASDRSARELSARLILLSGILLPISGPAAASGLGDGLWNLRENGDDRFHDNDSIVRPWKFNYDDGVGRWVFDQPRP